MQCSCLCVTGALQKASNAVINLTTDNIPQGNTNNYAVYPIPIGDISSFTITNPSTGQFLYYNGSQWINQNISENNVSNLTSDLLSCEKTSNKIQLVVIVH